MTDAITSLFQIGAIAFLIVNIVQLNKDRELKGVNIWMIIYFTVWAYWSIYMYVELDQFLSALMSIGIAVAYTIWLFLAWFILAASRRRL